MTVSFYVQAATPDKEVLQALFDNLDLLQQHQDLILSNPKYYNIHIQGSGVFALYIPTFSLFLGELLLLWQHTPWKQEDTYFYCITGSPLSGSNTSRYWNKEQGFANKYTPTFGKQLRSAIFVRRTGSPIYDEHKPTPVSVPKLQASDMTIFELIEELKQI